MKQGGPDLVCFDGIRDGIRDLTPASDIQLIRVEAWYQDFSGWESKWRVRTEEVAVVEGGLPLGVSPFVGRRGRGRDGREGATTVVDASGESNADAPGGGTVARGKLCHDQAVDTERQAEDGADSGGASSSDRGGAKAVFAEGQDEAGG